MAHSYELRIIFTDEHLQHVMIGSIYLNPHNVKGYPKIFPYFSSVDLYYTITVLYYYKLSIILYFELHCKSFGSLHSLFCINASQVALMVKKPPANAGDIRDPWVGMIPWRRAWQLTPVFLPGESHGQRAWWTIVHGVTQSWT